MAISTPVESMPSNADFEFIVPSVFANEKGTHVFQNTTHTWDVCQLSLLFLPSQLYWQQICTDLTVLSLHWRKARDVPLNDACRHIFPD